MPRPSSQLIRVAVEVQVENAHWSRQASVVDTGCTRSLIEWPVVQQLGMQSSLKETSDRLITVDGTPLDVTGSVDMTLKREDGSVYLPTIKVSLLVVPNLDALNTDIVIGSDIVSQVGGVSISHDQPGGQLSSVVFGPARDVASAGVAAATEKLSRHISVSDGDGQVTLRMDDIEATWRDDLGFWEATWRWKADTEPSLPLGSGVGEYPRKKLNPEQEQQFVKEVQMWRENGWLVPYDREAFGEPACVLPLMAVDQAHKASTPVRPCLDYRALNECLVSHPGLDAPACGQKLREWRLGDGDSALLDLSKAYLQIRMAPRLYRYQAIVWQGELFAMTRMGFGLNVAPKILDMVVKWVTKDLDGVDNYVDDLRVPDSQVVATTQQLERYGLKCKPAEKLPTARVLGLQLSTQDGTINWQRRRDVCLQLPEAPTKRAVFSWCGKLVSHYPVCAWLRPTTNWLKRMIGESVGWDIAVPPRLLQLCRDIQTQVNEHDPVRGVWSVQHDDATEWHVWCDASGIALGVVVQVNGEVIEDRSWLRPADDKRHINIAELDAVIKGLNAAANWPARKIRLHTDSKTVHGWLRQILGNERRVKVGGLHELLVKRRLQIIDDIVATARLDVEVDWVPSEQNLSDQLTRVPTSWLACTSDNSATDVAASLAIMPSLSMAEILAGQEDDGALQAVKAAVIAGDDLPPDSGFRNIRGQLQVQDGVLQRSVKLPPNDVKCVPVLPAALEERAVRAAHQVSGHSGWEATWQLLRSQCHFLGMGQRCQAFVSGCSSCQAANPRRGEATEPTRPVSANGPWDVVHIDTLELGVNRSGRYHCVLVCVDAFTKWVEVVPLKRHDGICVARAFVDVCSRWGPPRVVRSDNGTEFKNAVMSSVYEAFGVHFCYGAARH
eukprot:scpid31464/ scgid0234/ Protein NYNRIN; NYN domain and retroviral integrase catalytic domain-containing protein; Pol-like protein